MLALRFLGLVLFASTMGCSMSTTIDQDAGYFSDTILHPGDGSTDGSPAPSDASPDGALRDGGRLHDANVRD